MYLQTHPFFRCLYGRTFVKQQRKRRSIIFDLPVKHWLPCFYDFHFIFQLNKISFIDFGASFKTFPIQTINMTQDFFVFEKQSNS